jgi:hypothetical protein
VASWRRRRRLAGHAVGRARRPAFLLACLTVAGLLTAGVAGGTTSAVRTIRFLEVPRSPHGQLIDHNRNRRPDTGDSRLAVSDLYRWAGTERGAHLGSVQRFCIFATRSTANCAGAIFLSDGTIQIQGYVDFDDAADQLAVVGGTGAYVAMRGTLTARPVGQRPDRWADTLRLLR